MVARPPSGESLIPAAFTWLVVVLAAITVAVIAFLVVGNVLS